MRNEDELKIDNEQLLSAIEAAKLLRMSRSQLSRLVTNKRISVIRVGNRTFFNRTILDEFIKSCLVEAKREK